MIALPIMTAPSAASGPSAAPRSGYGGASFANHFAAASGATSGLGNGTASTTSSSSGSLPNWHGYVTRKTTNAANNTGVVPAAVTPQNPPAAAIPLVLLAAANTRTALGIASDTAPTSTASDGNSTAANGNALPPVTGAGNGSTANGATSSAAASATAAPGTVLTMQPGISAGIVGTAPPTSAAAVAAAAAPGAPAATTGYYAPNNRPVTAGNRGGQRRFATECAR